MTVGDVVRILEGNGFVCARRKGSHRSFRKSGGGRERVTVAGKDSDELPKGTLAAIRRQSGLPRRALR